MDEYRFIGDSKKIYDAMFKDIASAKESIYLESYIYDPDKIGREFRDEFIKKAKQGVKIKILLDWFGAKVNNGFFKDLIAAGGEVRFTREIRFHPKLLLHFHERDHRKLVLIDKDISYVGSINFSEDALEWVESMIRCKGGISKHFRRSFLEMFEHYNDHFIWPKQLSRTLKYEGFEILRDVPSWRYQKIRSKLIYLIKRAKKEITLEVPYFLPDLNFRLALKRAVKRGVNVTLLLPYVSDVRAVDVLRERYTGGLHNNGIKIYYYTKLILHSKIFLIDNNFILGSPNVDARTFIHNYEIAICGRDAKVISKIKEHFKETKKDSFEFDLEKWKKRSVFFKILETIMRPFKQWM